MVSNPVELIRLAANYSVLVALFAYFFRIRNTTRQVHIIGLLAIISATFDYVGLMFYNEQRSTVELFNTYYVLLFILIAWFYHEEFKSSNRQFWIGGLITGIAAFLFITFFVQDFHHYQTLFWAVSGAILLIFSVAYFKLIVITRQMVMSSWWINCAIFFYFGFNLWLFVLGDYILGKLEPETARVVWSFHNFNNIVKNVVFAIGIYNGRK